MQNPDKSTARIECWNDLTDENSTKSHDKLFVPNTNGTFR